MDSFPVLRKRSHSTVFSATPQCLRFIFRLSWKAASKVFLGRRYEILTANRTFFTQKEIGSCWHDLFLTNPCRLLLISLSSCQYLQTVVWSIPRKIWGKRSWQVCGSPATPLGKDKHRACPLAAPPLPSVNSQESSWQAWGCFSHFLKTPRYEAAGHWWDNI